jgi:hypothetical protein
MEVASISPPATGAYGARTSPGEEKSPEPHRLGEPFGALILTLSAIAIEIAVIIQP